MRYSEITEAPIADFQYFDQPERYGSRPEVKKSHDLFKNEKGRAKIYRMFSKTPFVFNFYVIPIKNISLHAPLSNEFTKAKLEELLGVENIETEGRITILYTNNVTNDDRPLNAWMLAHRIGHTLQVKYIDLGKIEAIYNRLLGMLIDLPNNYGFRLQLNGLRNNSSSGDWKYSNHIADALNRLHTMKSARDGIIGSRFDIDGLGELIAQYLITGRVKLNKLEGLENEITTAEQEINECIEGIIESMVGKIWNF